MSGELSKKPPKGRNKRFRSGYALFSEPRQSDNAPQIKTLQIKHRYYQVKSPAVCSVERLRGFYFLSDKTEFGVRRL